MDPEAILASRRSLPRPPQLPVRKSEAEGGCGVIGLASSVPVAGRHLLQPLRQMRNRGNGRGGGIAAAGLDPAFFGTTGEVLAEDYLLAVAFLEPSAQREVERTFLEPSFEVDHALDIPASAAALTVKPDVAPPRVRCWFVHVRPEVLRRFVAQHGFTDANAAADELVYQNTYRLNRACYAAAGEKRAFVLSHGKDLLVVKMVGYGDDVLRAYGLEGLRAHVWIGHHRYPTKGRVWHPGGAHPFVGMHEALVHNGDFANYASMCSTLAQRGVHPLFLTDTEVAVLAYDLLHRVHRYPPEYVIEALAPTTERDFTLLPPGKQRVYRMLRAVHIHGSPDGPWFFLIAQSDPASRACRLLGVTDTSMLRPQVFALQRGEASIGLAASEKQAIDAALESLSREDPRFCSRADLYWSARGGSHTDGGAFAFTVRRDRGGLAVSNELAATDKFGREVDGEAPGPPPAARPAAGPGEPARLLAGDDAPDVLFAEIVSRLASWSAAEVGALFSELACAAHDEAGRRRAIALLTLLLDRRFATGGSRRSAILAQVDGCLRTIVDSIRDHPSAGFSHAGRERPWPEPSDATVVVDARGFPAEGPRSLARAIVALHARGSRRLLVAEVRAQRFIGCGLGPGSGACRIDVYGSPGDYLASGIDGAEVVVHGSGQDQLAQIMKAGKLVVHGDVGQTFMYAAKGGKAFVLGSAAGRPLINAVGSPRVVINGTCLDYLAESFMAGDPLQGGGFAVVNGVSFDRDGVLRDLETPYPGGNLFSLAAGGAIYVRDPRRQVTEGQLNGGAFVEMTAEDWDVVRPCLEENEQLFGIPVRGLLSLDGQPLVPAQAYRKIRPSGHEVLQPEEAWVKREA